MKTVLALVVITTFAFGPRAGAQPAPAGPSEARVARNVSQVHLPNTGGARVTPASMRLGPGSWTFVTKVSAVNFGEADYVRCELKVNGQTIDGATSHIGTTNFVATVTTAGGMQSGSPLNVALECWHDANRGGIYLDPGATIVATRVTGLSVTTLP